MLYFIFIELYDFHKITSDYILVLFHYILFIVGIHY